MQSRRNDVDTITLHLHFQTDPDSRYRTPLPHEQHVFIPNTAKPRALRPPINSNPPNTQTPYNNRTTSTTTMRLVGQRFHGQRPIHDPPSPPANRPTQPRQRPPPPTQPRQQPPPLKLTTSLAST